MGSALAQMDRIIIDLCTRYMPPMRERESVCACVRVCVCERERERKAI
jgi:hypothetical protein